MSNPENNTTVGYTRNMHIHSKLKTVYDLIEFSDWLATQGLPGDTTITFSGYNEVRITSEHRELDPEWRNPKAYR